VLSRAFGTISRSSSFGRSTGSAKPPAKSLRANPHQTTVRFIAARGHARRTRLPRCPPAARRCVRRGRLAVSASTITKRASCVIASDALVTQRSRRPCHKRVTISGRRNGSLRVLGRGGVLSRVSHAPSLTASPHGRTTS
jgi:hypothetical protein